MPEGLLAKFMGKFEPKCSNLVKDAAPTVTVDEIGSTMKELITVTDVINWTKDEVSTWRRSLEHPLFDVIEEFDGKMLLILTKEDIIRWRSKKHPDENLLEKLWFSNEVRKLQLKNIEAIERLGYDPTYVISGLPRRRPYSNDAKRHSQSSTDERSEDGSASRLRPEFAKTFISFVYLLLVTLLTAFVMVVVHNRVPDMKKYPPLPDIFLDNVPHIPWAFAMCECTATLLFIIWLAVLLFHKHRFIILRRFFAISGTVFLLRCVTMVITSLSVPGTHLQCSAMAEELQASDSMWSKMQRAYHIWSGAGMSIQGVRTCGDYMFSGHTSALTILNFFVTEYTPRHLYFIHTFSWVLNMFGIFFILSAHEHYSIDVFIAFYITSRLFLYYHTLANNQALMQRDSTRTRIWFPLFSFFESEIDGIIPNEFDTPSSLMSSVVNAANQFCTYCYSVSMRRPFAFEKRKKS